MNKVIMATLVSLSFLTPALAQNEITEVNRTVLLSATDSCYVLGDSIAVGISTQMQNCSANAKKGISSQQFLGRMTSNTIRAHKVIISLGVNDGPTTATEKNLTLLRNKIEADEVDWILPNPKYEQQRQAVVNVAVKFHDHMKSVEQYASSDGLHPTWKGYKAIAYQLASK